MSAPGPAPAKVRFGILSTANIATKNVIAIRATTNGEVTVRGRRRLSASLPVARWWPR